MKTLLVIDSSGRVTRSVTRQLTERFTQRWLEQHPAGHILHRDVGLEPPRIIDESWIASAFAKPGEPVADAQDVLRESESYIREIERADAIVLGVPMYNFGMPAALKAYFDQIIRVGRTFDFTEDVAHPYLPLLASKPVVLITATGTSGYEPGGPNAHENFLEPHVQMLLGFIGLPEVHLVRVGFEEAQDGAFRRSLAQAEQELDALAAALPGSPGQPDGTAAGVLGGAAIC